MNKPLYKCDNCNYVFQKDEKVCPACGKSFEPPKTFFNVSRNIGGKFLDNTQNDKK